MHVEAGHVIYQQGQPSDDIYLVLNGRLRAITENATGKNVSIAGEYGYGESVGELEVLSMLLQIFVLLLTKISRNIQRSNPTCNS